MLKQKGKGTKLGKSRATPLIDADLQLIMRTCINRRRKFVIEGNSITSKRNYGSKSGYSIENTLLEKSRFIL